MVKGKTFHQFNNRKMSNSHKFIPLLHLAKTKRDGKQLNFRFIKSNFHPNMNFFDFFLFN